MIREKAEEKRARLLEDAKEAAAKVLEEAEEERARLLDVARGRRLNMEAVEKEKASTERKSSWIKLNVGGHRFETSLQTLTSVPDTYFSSYFSVASSSNQTKITNTA